MGRKKKVEEIKDIAPELAKAAEDGVITEDEIKEIVEGKKTEQETGAVSDVETTEQEANETEPELTQEPVVEVGASTEDVDTEETEVDGQNNEGDLVDNSGTVATKQAPVEEEEGIDPETKLDAKGVAGVISDADLSGKEKIRKIASTGMTGFAAIASKIIGYDQIMNPKTPVTEVAGVAKQYDLLNTLKSVINTEDYKQFKVKFDIINLGFRVYSKDAFDEFMLFRFDQKWKWSKKDLTTSQHLSSLISQLCDLSTRANNLKKIDIDRALDASAISLSETGINNVKKYYTM